MKDKRYNESIFIKKSYKITSFPLLFLEEG